LTYDIYRDDGIKDNVLNYFIVGLANHFSVNGNVEVIFNQYPDRNVIKHLNSIENVKLVVKTTILLLMQRWIRNTFGPLPVLYGYFKVIFDKEGIENLLFAKVVMKNIFLTHINTKQSRWKGYPNALKLKEDQAYFLDVDLQRCITINGSKTIKLKLFTKKNFFNAVKKSYQIFHALKQYSNSVNSIFKEEIKNQSYLQIFAVIWRFYAWEVLFVKYGVTDIHVMTTFGDPFRRLPLAVARSKGAKSHIFACRPYLSNYRSEDRIVTSDKKELSICKIPKDIIVLDKYSQNQLTKVGVVASIYNPISKSIKITAHDGLLLLFSDADFNDNIIKLVNKLKGLKFNLYIREHPLVKLEDHLKEQLILTGNSVIDLNQYDWSELHFRKVLTFSANTTAGLDALARGCDLFWLPFLSQNFLQFAGYANDTGKVIFCEKEWTLAVDEYFKTK
jgi:hypothetical protein